MCLSSDVGCVCTKMCDMSGVKSMMRLMCELHCHQLHWLVHRQRELQMMKKGAFIVNYARADVIREQVSGIVHT